MNIQDATMELIGAALVVWLLVGFVTAIARMVDLERDITGSVAAGVLWPIYLPYRLIGLIRARAA